MPWQTPALREVRELIRDDIASRLPGADANIPNSVLRVLADANAGLAHLNLLYLDWLALQLLPDTAETEWLDRHANIWLGGRKAATYATGVVTFTGTEWMIVPLGARLRAPNGIEYETLDETMLSAGPTGANVRAIDTGPLGNQAADTELGLVTAIAGVDAVAVVNADALTGGAGVENDDDLRERVLLRIRRPPMGGSADDYVQWALAIPGVTRAWCSPLEMGIGTVTVRVMLDELRASFGGFPQPGDLDYVKAELDAKRPVAVKDFFVLAPIPEPINFTIDDLVTDTLATRAALEVSVAAMLRERAAPAYAVNGVRQDAQTIYAAWVAEAALAASGVEHFELVMTDHVMPSPGHMAVLGTVTYT